MAKYTLLQKSDIHAIISRYNLSLQNFEYIDGGAGNTSYLLRTNIGKIVLTVFEIPKVRVERIGKLLLLLKKHHFPATRVLPQKNGKLISSYFGKPILLKFYIEGQVHKNLDQKMLEQAGNAMARLHKIPAPDYLPDGYAYNLNAFPNVINKNIDREFEIWLHERYNYLKKHIPNELPSCIIHADLFHDNVLYKDKKFRALIDFEDTCYDHRIFDIGMGILGMCTNDSTILLDKASAFVNGYLQQNQLEDREINSLKLFVEYAAIGIAYWRFWMYNIHTPIKKKANKHKQMMRLAQRINGIPNSVFNEIINNQ